jgi:hypothetical protein
MARALGFRFIILCEHTKRLPPATRPGAAAQCRQATDEDFLCVFALEFSFEGRHVLLLGPEELLCQADDPTVVLTPESVRSQGGLTIWAHPAATSFWTLRRGQAADYDGWEVWNQYTDGPTPSFPMLARLQRQRRSGRSLLAFGGTDFHDAKRHSLFPALEVDLPHLDADLLIASLRAGDYSVAPDAGSAPTISAAAAQLTRAAWSSLLYAAIRFALLRLRSLAVFVTRTLSGD